MFRLDAALDEGCGDDVAGDALATTYNPVGDSRTKFENRREAAQDFIELVEFLVDQGLQGGGCRRVLYKRGGGVAVARTQPRTDGQSAGLVALAGS